MMSNIGYKRCWQCGAENADDRDFCGICKEPLDINLISSMLTKEEKIKLKKLLSIIEIDQFNNIKINGILQPIDIIFFPNDKS
jgi:hypothetical protein